MTFESCTNFTPGRIVLFSTNSSPWWASFNNISFKKHLMIILGEVDHYDVTVCYADNPQQGSSKMEVMKQHLWEVPLVWVFIKNVQ